MLTVLCNLRDVDAFWLPNLCFLLQQREVSQGFTLKTTILVHSWNDQLEYLCWVK